jgi:hypothetical protein
LSLPISALLIRKFYQKNPPLFPGKSKDKIRRGAFKSVADLEAAITDYLAKHNAAPTPFVWTKTADVILTKVGRARAKLNAVKNGYQALESEH